jgi:hypothetical protein
MKPDDTKQAARHQTAQPLQWSAVAAVALCMKSHVTEGVYISRTTLQTSHAFLILLLSFVEY